MQALELEGWCDTLENCSHSEIRQAWAQYQRTGPLTTRGSLVRPSAGVLYRMIIAARPKPAVVKTEEPDDRSWRIRTSLTPEQLEERRKRAADILASFKANRK